MSYFSARLFSWVQDAAFYRQLHQEAVSLLPRGSGQSWLDAGCGPGLVTRLAAAHGYRAVGVDIDPHMIGIARRIGQRQASSGSLRFEIADLEHLPERSAEVVSAASLLAVMDDRPAALDALLRCTRPGGTLLIIEPTTKMTRDSARQLNRSGRPGTPSLALRLWAYAREGRAVDPEIFYATGHPVEKTLLLDGLVAAWRIRKSSYSIESSLS